MKQIKIIREINLQDFENEINKLLAAGWKRKGIFCIDKEDFLYQMLEKKKT